MVRDFLDSEASSDEFSDFYEVLSTGLAGLGVLGGCRNLIVDGAAARYNKCTASCLMLCVGLAPARTLLSFVGRK